MLGLQRNSLCVRMRASWLVATPLNIFKDYKKFKVMDPSSSKRKTVQMKINNQPVKCMRKRLKMVLQDKRNNCSELVGVNQHLNIIPCKHLLRWELLNSRSRAWPKKTRTMSQAAILNRKRLRVGQKILKMKRRRINNNQIWRSNSLRRKESAGAGHKQEPLREHNRYNLKLVCMKTCFSKL